MVSPPTILGYSLLWYDSFQAWEEPEQRPYRNWDAIKLYEPNQGTHEQQYYDTTKDLTYMYSRIPGGPGGGPGTPSQLFILPQKKDGRIYSARLEGKEAHGCKEGKSLILQASLIAGNATSDKQSGVWPAFWALGKSLKDKTQPWPLCGEWDIFETSSGHDWSLGTVHYGVVGNDGKAQDHIVGSEKNKFDHTQYHTWALKVDRTNSDWTKQTLQWFMDDNQFFEVKGSDVPDKGVWETIAWQAYYPVLNVAFGTEGSFPENGNTNDKTSTGTDTGMVIDYVAFYESD